ncbi:hypothetical protein C9E85_16620 [Plesiomonas shigelloides]|nr:hypothetical protein C9E85_16620 [Plesiomonas shigelloides]
MSLLELLVIWLFLPLILVLYLHALQKENIANALQLHDQYSTLRLICNLLIYVYVIIIVIMMHNIQARSSISNGQISIFL